ncbi:protein-S-isoprenylcysteine O-methyltransferase [Ancistrocladus abbreviatus]
MTAMFSNTASIQLSELCFAIVFFHVSEFVLAISIHGMTNVTLTSLLISKNYIIAMICSLLEYLVEVTLFPALKEHWWINGIGLAMVVIGEIIRKMAMLTAGRAFTHLIKIRHEEHHKLVTHGIYGVVRHPVIAWQFFAQRIPYEEHYLRQFFGAKYEEYAQRVPSGIPFVK